VTLLIGIDAPECGLVGDIDFVTGTIGSAEAAVRDAWQCPVFGDIVTKMTVAADREVERPLNLGVPVIVDRGNGLEELTRPSDPLRHQPALRA